MRKQEVPDNKGQKNSSAEDGEHAAVNGHAIREESCINRIKRTRTIRKVAQQYDKVTWRRAETERGNCARFSADKFS